MKLVFCDPIHFILFGGNIYSLWLDWGPGYHRLDRLDRLSSVCRRSHSTICIVTLLSEYYLYAYISNVCILELASMHRNTLASMNISKHSTTSSTTYYVLRARSMHTS